MTAPVSVVVITRNEEQHIGRCLNSVRWAAESIVVDACSLDRTAEVAEELGARVYRRDWPGYGAQKNFGVEKATQAWVLNIDADEEVTQSLAEEITRTVADQPVEAAFSIRIPLRFLGRQLGHYGRATHDSRHIRLFRKGHASFDDRIVHESVHVDGQVGELQGIVLHESYPPPATRTYWRKIHYYARLEALERAANGESGGNRWVRAVGKLGWMLLFRKGLLHGPAAWIWISGQAYQEWLTTGMAARRLHGLRTGGELA